MSAETTPQNACIPSLRGSAVQPHRPLPRRATWDGRTVFEDVLCPFEQLPLDASLFAVGVDEMEIKDSLQEECLPPTERTPPSCIRRVWDRLATESRTVRDDGLMKGSTPLQYGTSLVERDDGRAWLDRKEVVESLPILQKPQILPRWRPGTLTQHCNRKSGLVHPGVEDRDLASRETQSLGLSASSARRSFWLGNVAVLAGEAGALVLGTFTW